MFAKMILIAGYLIPLPSTWTPSMGVVNGRWIAAKRTTKSVLAKELKCMYDRVWLWYKG